MGQFSVTIYGATGSVLSDNQQPGASVTEVDVITHCRDNLAHFKAPKTVVFGDLPKTSTGKIQKFILREQARNLPLQS